MSSSILWKWMGDASSVLSEFEKIERLQEQVSQATGRSVRISQSGQDKLRITLGKTTQEYARQGREVDKVAAGFNRMGQQGQAALAKIRGQEKIAAGFRRMGQSGERTRGVLSRMQANSRQTQFALTQLSFAAQDAAVSWGITGFAGAVRGASNNLGLAMSAISPAAGIIGGLAFGAVAPLAAGFLSVGKNAEDAGDKMKIASRGTEEYRASINRLNSEIDQLLEKDVGGAEAERSAASLSGKAQEAKRRREALERIERAHLEGGDPVAVARAQGRQGLAAKFELNAIGALEQVQSEINAATAEENVNRTASRETMAKLRQRSLLTVQKDVTTKFTPDTEEGLAQTLEQRQQRVGNLRGLTDQDRIRINRELTEGFEDRQVEVRRQRRADFAASRPRDTTTALERRIEQAAFEADRSRLAATAARNQAISRESPGGARVTRQEKELLAPLEEIARTNALVLEELRLQRREEKLKPKRLNPGGQR